MAKTDRRQALARHRRRQGAILLLLLLGPAPISFALFLLGTSTVVLAGVLTATVALVALMLELYRRQRAEARQAGLPVLPGAQVGALLAIVGCVAGGTFLLPGLPQVGLLLIGLCVVIVYGMGRSLARQLEAPDERSVVLVLGLAASLIALANAFV